MKKWMVVIGLQIFLYQYGCAHRSTSEIDVDSVQGRVDQIDVQLKRFQQSLQLRDISGARKSLERAQEIVEEHADELAAYPELGDLKERLAQAAVSLCAVEIQVALSHFFAAVRDRDLSESRKRLEKLNECWRRCSERHPREEEISSLRAAVESAPAEIERLRKLLEEEKLAKAAEQAESELRDRLRNLAAIVEQQSKTSLPADKLQQLSDMLKQYRQEVENTSLRLNQNPFWKQSLDRLSEEEKKVQEKVSYWQRRNELWRIASEELPKAESLNRQAIVSRDPQEALSLVEQSHAIYSRCFELVSNWLKEDPQLVNWQVNWKGTKRDTRWLKTHCKSNADITGRLVKKISGRSLDEPQKKSATQKDEPDKNNKTQPRRGRVKRW